MALKKTMKEMGSVIASANGTKRSSRSNTPASSSHALTMSKTPVSISVTSIWFDAGRLPSGCGKIGG
ncbi:hypothetical protein D3C72_2439140 [compost metagenome]